MTKLHNTPIGYLSERQYLGAINEKFENLCPTWQVLVSLRYGKDLVRWFEDWAEGKFKMDKTLFQEAREAQEEYTKGMLIKMNTLDQKSRRKGV